MKQNEAEEGIEMRKIEYKEEEASSPFYFSKNARLNEKRKNKVIKLYVINKLFFVLLPRKT